MAGGDSSSERRRRRARWRSGPPLVLAACAGLSCCCSARAQSMSFGTLHQHTQDSSGASRDSTGGSGGSGGTSGRTHSPLDPFQRAALFNSPECRDFFRNRGLDLPDVPPENTLVWEDFNDPLMHEPYATTSTYCPVQRLVYVDNPKAGSTTVRTMLREQFQCSWTAHRNWPPEDSAVRNHFCALEPPAIATPDCKATRSRTTWFVDSIISGSFFFSVVRNPIARFVSGYLQAVTTTDYLEGMTLPKYIQNFRHSPINEHTSTQARRISGRDAYGRQVPMHFIASLENLEHDMAVLWAHLGLPEVEHERGTDRIQHANTASLDPTKQHFNTTLTAEQIRELCDHLAQDFVCFGYPLPPECR